MSFAEYDSTISETVKKGLKAAIICEVISKCKARNIGWKEYRTRERALKHGSEHSVRTEVFAAVFKYVPARNSLYIGRIDARWTGITRKS